MAKKKSYTTFRNKNLFCGNCGKEMPITYPIGIPELIQQTEIFDAAHENCEPVWMQPEADMTQSIQERIVWWVKYGEHGNSSQTIWCTLTKGSDFKFNYDDLMRVLIPETGYTYPADPGDFHRCYMLLKAVPEWRGELHKLSRLSPVWERLVYNWDKLTEKLEEQINTGKSNDMYRFMKSLGC